MNGPTPIVYKPVKPFWDALYAAKADVLLVGHQHFYERFAPMTSDGVLDNANGLREFVVGTGGKSKGGSFQATAPNSQVKNTGTWGVLKLTLDAASYSWQFLPEAGKSFTDTGTGTCHPKGSGGGMTMQANAGNAQTATVGTAVATPPSVKVTDGSSNPVPGVSVSFAVGTGGGSITGGSQTTDGGGIATVGSWTLGTVAGANSLTASSAGVSGSPVTFNATSVRTRPTPPSPWPQYRTALSAVRRRSQCRRRISTTTISPVAARPWS